MRLRWLVGLAILGVALTYSLLLQDYLARQWPELSWVMDALFCGVLGGLTVWACLTWIERRLQERREEPDHLAAAVNGSTYALVTLDKAA